MKTYVEIENYAEKFTTISDAVEEAERQGGLFMNDKLKKAIENCNGMKRPFMILSEDGEGIRCTNINEIIGKPLYCVYNRGDKIAVFWGNIHFNLHGEETFLLTECDANGEGKDCLVSIDTYTGNQSARLVSYEKKYWLF